MNITTPASLMEPRHLSAPAPWAGHIPFAAWLMSIQRPDVLVELGAYSGISYLAFCQAIREQDLPTRTFAVDTWQGDAHAGAYGDDIYQTLRRAHDPLYAQFSTLMRMTFNQALDSFSANSVDLLHIDGLHTYEAVRHDFETWLPKLSPRAVVLFHDTNVFRDDFGVHKLWAELCTKYPSLQFMHSNGLGVLLVGQQQPPELLQLCQTNESALTKSDQTHAQRIFSILGARLERQAEILALRHELEDARLRETALTQAGEQRHHWIEQLDQQVRDLELRHTHEKNTIESLESNLAQRDQTVAQLEAKSNRQNQSLAATEALVQEIYASRSWRVTAGLRALTRSLRILRAAISVNGLRRARNAMRYLIHGHWRALGQRIFALNRESVANGGPALPVNIRHVGVMATKHTMFVAHLLANAFEKTGFQVSVFDDVPPDGFNLHLYVVVCPQMFKRLPPGEKRIAFQMEQSVSSRWFTPEYLHTLENSLAVFDYSQTNLQFLQTKGISYPHTYLVPVGGLRHYPQYLARQQSATEKPDTACDVLFYGATNAPRRQTMLAELKKHFTVRVEGDLFGPALHRALTSAKVVVNIHYYEGALLETTRIFECLSLGVPLVSETSADMAEHVYLEEVVRFVPVGDTNAMINALRLSLEQPTDNQAQHLANANAIATSGQRFEFMFFRALYAMHLLDHQEWQRLTAIMPLPGACMALSLPETPLRRAAFQQVCPPGVQTFDGLRYQPGWIGCALSYQHMARHALQDGLPQLEVMEDDVLFPPDYVARRAVVDEWLAANNQKWDVFAGLIAQVHTDTQILAVEEFQGITFVTLNRMTSMVHNIYAPATLALLATWDPNNSDPYTNTIDSFLQTQSQLRVVVVLPFLVEHREDADSSLWGINNTRYSDMILESQKTLHDGAYQFRSALANSRGA